MWRGHNREHVFADERERRAYLKDLCDTLNEQIQRHVEWFSYCLMTNHTHENGRVIRDDEGDLDAGIDLLGNWMRNAHSRFGQRYNEDHDRQGKVAYDRPKTMQVKDRPEDMQRVMFYGDVNPVRAGLVKHPSQYRYSSYRFYAFGEVDDITKHLTVPDWYLELGKTKEARQKRYRQLCDRYLREEGLLNDEPLETVPDQAKRVTPTMSRVSSATESTTARAGPSG